MGKQDDKLQKFISISFGSLLCLIPGLYLPIQADPRKLHLVEVCLKLIHSST